MCVILEWHFYSLFLVSDVCWLNPNVLEPKSNEACLGSSTCLLPERVAVSIAGATLIATAAAAKSDILQSARNQQAREAELDCCFRPGAQNSGVFHDKKSASGSSSQTQQTIVWNVYKDSLAEFHPSKGARTVEFCYCGWMDITDGFSLHHKGFIVRPSRLLRVSRKISIVNLQLLENARNVWKTDMDLRILR